MRMVSAIIGLILAGFAIVHAFLPYSSSFIYIYAAGAILAFVTVKPGRLGVHTARFFAICTTAVMFFYFAGFFKMAPYFTETWYQTGHALEGLGMLFSAFLMIPILSCYSCLLKAEGCEHFKEKAKRPAFFRVPEDIQQNP